MAEDEIVLLAQKKRPVLGRNVVVGLSAFVMLVFAGSWVAGRVGDEFDLSNRSVPLEQIESGGPGKDGIPAILNPHFVRATQASFLKNEDRILGIAKGGEAKAYPIKILNWHEIVNDTLAGKPILVTYCPLCGTGIGFTPVLNGRVLTFGVSGLLYQSDLVMYDHQTESLWSQISMEAIAGPMTGAKLRHIFLDHTTWAEWKREHPNTLVLSADTGHDRDYGRDPYENYAKRRDLMFDVTNFDPTYHPKTWVVGVEVGGTQKAYAFTELEKLGLTGALTDQVNGRTIQVHFDREARSAWVTDEDERPLPSVMAFWFAWYAFHPDTQVYTVPD